MDCITCKHRGLSSHREPCKGCYKSNCYEAAPIIIKKIDPDIAAMENAKHRKKAKKWG